jgi:ribonuclease-3
MSEADSPRDERPPSASPDDPVAILERRVGMSLGDRRTAVAALTHKSYVNEHRDEAGLTDNERLEFLGDAVIDLAVSHRLMERFPVASEGDLSKMRAAVVDEQGLSEMARALDLGALLRLGRGEELTGGRRKASLLADAMEAVVATLYLGGGLEAVLTLVDRFLGEAFARAAAGTLDRDYKTQLQELAQSRLRATPRYRVVGEHGPDHSKTFEVETDLRGEVLGRGTGRSKKDAEQAAAKLALDQLGRRFGAPGNGAPLAVEASPPDAAATPRPGPAPEAVVAPPPDVERAAPPEPAPGAAVPAEEPHEPAETRTPGEPPPRRRQATKPRTKSPPKPARAAARPKKPAAKPARKGKRPRR